MDANVPPLGEFAERSSLVRQGVLVDLSSVASELRMDLPVMCTADVYKRYIVPAAGAPPDQTIEYRTRNVLGEMGPAIKIARMRSTTSVVRFRVRLLMPLRGYRIVSLAAVCGPDSSGEWGITIVNRSEV